MDPGADAAGNALRAGKRGRGGRERGPILGGTRVPGVRLAGADYAAADRGTDSGDLRLGPVLGAILYSRQRNPRAQAELNAGRGRRGVRAQSAARHAAGTTRCSSQNSPAATSADAGMVRTHAHT